MNKRTFLLKHSLQLPFKNPIGEYDSNESLNISIQNGKRIPVVSIAGGPPTNSKTLSSPGDDDPDPGQEQCY